MPEEFDDGVMNQAILSAGNDVGDLAMGLFGEYTEVPYSEHLSEMIPATQKLIEEGVKNICEASFSYDGCFCSVDILRNLGGNKVELYEVKSSTSVKWIYEHDVSYQYYVMTKLGYEVQKACLVHINNQYVRHGELELDKLFAISDLTKLEEKEIKSSGYVVDTLEAALWAFFTTNSYKECLLKAVNLGYDADSVGAVTGGLAGLYYCTDEDKEIPESWMEKVRGKKLLDTSINDFAKKFF